MPVLLQGRSRNIAAVAVQILTPLTAPFASCGPHRQMLAPTRKVREGNSPRTQAEVARLQKSYGVS